VILPGCDLLRAAVEVPGWLTLLLWLALPLWLVMAADAALPAGLVATVGETPPLAADGRAAVGCLLAGAEMAAVVWAGAPAVAGGACLDCRARNGIIAYTVSETIATSRTVNSEPTMRTRGERSILAGPGRRNAAREVARPGSSLASRCSISASMRCSSCESAIPLPFRFAPCDYPLTIAHEAAFIQLFRVRSRPVFRGARSAGCGHRTQSRACIIMASRRVSQLWLSKNRSILIGMRWDNLRLDDGPEDGGATLFPAGRRDGTLPLIERGAVARSFDTPGFRGMTFYEVQSRSVVNRVPESSRMSFRWTINPYRGCQHSCVYCMAGQTPILMADGRTKPLADVRAGDQVYGTVRDGRDRRCAVTTVLAHWTTVKPAYRVILEDSTLLLASDDHRFLTERGWKHVTGADSGPMQRPFLTLNNELVGIGRFAEPPKASAAYERGYLCGMIRGDGAIGHYSNPRAPGPGGGDVHRFRLALADREALARTAGYLASTGISCTELAWAEEPATDRRVGAIRTSGRDQVQMIEQLTEWPPDPGPDWRKGFLAGIFDAEGSFSRGILRISHTDQKIIDQTVTSFQAFGFQVAIEPIARRNGLVVVRLRGGLREALRFFHAVDPAITAKRSIEGVALKSGARLRVAAIEPTGLDLPMYDITTGTGDFIADGVVSHNCFARNTHSYLGLDSGADFDSKVVVKVNAPELVRKKLASPSWAGEHIAMGTNVDCYQRAEGRYRLMPGIIGALKDAANPFSILTKGTLILRDIDLLAEAAEVTDVGLNVSAGFVDKELWRSVEPGTPDPARRLEACAALNDRGLACGVLMGPVIPFLSDSPAQLGAAVRQIAAAGATHVTPIVLHLRPGTREWYMRWLGAHHPGLVGRYLDLYGRSAYAPKSYQARITAQVRDLAARYGVGGPRSMTSRGRGPGAAPPGPRGPADMRSRGAAAPLAEVGPGTPPGRAQQLTLL
jgi:DNA repair photolyase